MLPTHATSTCLRVLRRAAPLAATPFSACVPIAETQRCHVHSTCRDDVPPPLSTSSSRRRPAFHNRLRHLSTPAAAAAIGRSSRSTFAMRNNTTATSWTDVLAQGSSGAAAPSRVALSEAAALCLQVESPKCYAVYRPGRTGDAANDLSAISSASPQQFVELLEYLRIAPELSREAMRIAQVLVDLLLKTPNPHRPSAWDVTDDEARMLKADAIAHVMEGAVSGEVALSWLVGLLELSDTLGKSSRSVERALLASEMAWLPQLAISERLRASSATPTTHRVRVQGPDGEWLLTHSSTVLGAIAAAMLRSDAAGMTAGAVDLLEMAALSRLTRASRTAAPSRTSSLVDGSRDTLFSESVAVHCAEVAAVRGDAETVTRLIFLLYRTRGALGFATLAQQREQRRSRDTTQVSRRLLPRTSAWVSNRWWRGNSGGNVAAAVESTALRTGLEAQEVDDDANADVLLEQAVVRLLKTAMHAVLYHPHRGGRTFAVDEALSLWDGLRGGTSWPGLAAMGIELLTFLVDQHTFRNAVMESSGGSDGVAMDAHEQWAGLHVYDHLRLAAPARRRTKAQEDVLLHCAWLMARLFAVATGEKGNVTVKRCAAAEQLLRCFSHVTRPAEQEALLPYALAASLTLLSTAAMQKTYRIPPAAYASLATYFSQVQSLHHYCVAPASAPSHVAATGALILLHVFLVTTVTVGEWARDRDDLWSLIQRLRALDDGKKPIPVRDTSAVQHERCAAWLRVSGEAPRQQLWSLLLSIKRGDARWCDATRMLVASPALSTAIIDSVASLGTPSLSKAEQLSVMLLLYECGNNNVPVRASRTLDAVVSVCLDDASIRTLTLRKLTQHTQQLYAAGIPTAVFILGASSLRALVQRHASGTGTPASGDDVEALLRCLLPLLSQPSTAPAPPSSPFVCVVVTPSCLLELHRLHTGCNAAGVVHALYAALMRGGDQSTPQLMHQVAAASAWPCLPSITAALHAHGGMRGVDGLREAIAVARQFAQTCPKEARPTVCMWTEEATSPLPDEVATVKADLLQHYGVLEVSVHRAHVEKAKRDIFSVMRGVPAGVSAVTTLRVSADVAFAEASAARRARHTSLLDAVSHKSNHQRSL